MSKKEAFYSVPPLESPGEISLRTCTEQWMAIENYSFKNYQSMGDEWFETRECGILQQHQDTLTALSARINGDPDFAAAVKKPMPSEIKYGLYPRDPK